MNHVRSYEHSTATKSAIGFMVKKMIFVLVHGVYLFFSFSIKWPIMKLICGLQWLHIVRCHGYGRGRTRWGEIIWNTTTITTKSNADILSRYAVVFISFFFTFNLIPKSQPDCVKICNRRWWIVNKRVFKSC